MILSNKKKKKKKRLDWQKHPGFISVVYEEKLRNGFLEFAEKIAAQDLSETRWVQHCHTTFPFQHPVIDCKGDLSDLD